MSVSTHPAMEGELLEEDKLMAQLDATLASQNVSQENRDLIYKAFEYARLKHTGQTRKNGENYIVHPAHVALILSGMIIDPDTTMGALLHDVLEDTDAKPEEIQKQFGPNVLQLVEGVTKLSKFKFDSKETRQAENFRKMFLAMASDLRVIILKLADRLHNMRTLHHLKPEKQARIARETLEIFAPLANRMGMGNIRAELEDLSLKYVDPEGYQRIANEVAHTQMEREKTLKLVSEKVSQQLSKMSIEAKIYGRVKNFYSIYKKMSKRDKPLGEIFDISAVRILVESEKECYEALGIIHHNFKPIPGRFKDYIAMPKSNLYQSLHTTVIGPYGRPLEVQIRTRQMHRIAEYGIAAHWRYKESGPVTSESSDDQKLSWMKQMLELKEDVGDAQEYVDCVKLDLFSDEVFVFTPKGTVVDLPKGSTPIDFAYRIHTEVGHSCSGAMVNGKIVPLDTQLSNGDFVEVMTSKKATPRLDWIKFVKTHQAKSRIRSWFKKNFKDEHESQGRSSLDAELGRSVVDEAIKDGRMLEVARALNYVSLEDMLVALGYGELNISRITNRLKLADSKKKEATAAAAQALLDQAEAPPVQRPSSTPSARQKTRAIEGLQGMLYNLAKCCTAVPGEQIVGVITRSRGVMVHREGCPNLATANPNRLMDLSWDGGGEKEKAKDSHSVKLEVEVIDRVGVFKDILIEIANCRNTNVSNAKVKQVSQNNFAMVEVTVDVNDIEHLNAVITAIRRVPDVLGVKRQQFRTSNANL